VEPDYFQAGLGMRGPPLTRRELLINWGRLSLLRWRMVRGAALPACAMTALRILDRWSSERAIDRPWTPAASNRLDRVLDQSERDR